MSTLLDTIEPETITTRSFGEELQASMAAVRLTIRWFGVRRSVSGSQKRQAAETFDAETKFVSMGKKLLDTNHPAWKSLVGVRGKIVSTWKHNSLPFPEPGIRLIKRRNVEMFTVTLDELRDELRDAERDLDNHYDELRSTAKNRLGSLYNPADYPASMIGMFDVTVDYPSVEAPEYLRGLSPALYRQETERVRVRFDEAVKLAEDAFLGELTKLVDHLAERISGSEDGKPKIFRDTVVTNLVDFFDRFRRLNIGSLPMSVGSWATPRPANCVTTEHSVNMSPGNCPVFRPVSMVSWSTAPAVISFAPESGRAVRCVRSDPLRVAPLVFSITSTSTRIEPCRSSLNRRACSSAFIRIRSITANLADRKSAGLRMSNRPTTAAGPLTFPLLTVPCLDRLTNEAKQSTQNWNS